MSETFIDHHIGAWIKLVILYYRFSTNSKSETSFSLTG